MVQLAGKFAMLRCSHGCSKCGGYFGLGFGRVHISISSGFNLTITTWMPWHRWSNWRARLFNPSIKINC
jgi:hypothetical protein